ncbi:MAG: cobalt ECF transporter T component CbiQ [Clostridiales bacterium]|nr:cobalt ECF transporter T component CbiQ [Clostridiales bacterium]
MAGLQKQAAGLYQLEQLALADSPLHRLHPLAKLLSTLVYLVAVISRPPGEILTLLPFALFPGLLLAFSRISPKYILGRAVLVLPFPLLAGLGNLFILKDPVYYLGLFAVSQGMLFLLSLLLKALFTVSSLILLIACTSLRDLGGQLLRLKIPKAFCLQLFLTYRYLSLLLLEAGAMFQAYLLRAPGQKGIKIKDMGSFLGALLLRSFERANRIYQAMQCRGFADFAPKGSNRKLILADWIYLLGVFGAAAGLVFL